MGVYLSIVVERVAGMVEREREREDDGAVWLMEKSLFVPGMFGNLIFW